MAQSVSLSYSGEGGEAFSLWNVLDKSDFPLVE